MNSQAVAATPVADVKVNRFVAQVYLLMTLGLLVTGVTSTAVASNKDFILRLATSPWLAFGLFIIQIAIVGFLSGAVMQMKAGLAFILFLLYAGLTGVTLSTLFLYYGQANISSVFWMTAGTFFLASVVGLITKKDLGSAGMVLVMLLLGWSFMWFMSWFFPYSNFNWAMNFIGIALFVGLAAWDSNRIKNIGAQVGSHPARGGLVVIGALALYLDFINLFLLMLRASRR
jgi:FtsH-binding integral membrane protein